MTPDARRPWRERLAGLRPYPFELLTYGAALATLIFLRARGLHYGWNTISHTFFAVLWTLPLMLVVGVGLRALADRVVGEPVLPYLRAVASRRWLSLWLRLVACFVGYVYAYTWLKVSVPLLRADLDDFQLWRLDRWLHLGVSPTVLAIELVAGTPLAWWIDRYYGYWLYIVPLWTAFVYSSTRDDARRHFAFGVSLMWIAGAWIYYAVPAVGPCYWSPDVMDPVRGQMPLAEGTQWNLWQQYRGMLEARGGTLRVFSPALGVAALPSLHVAAFVFFALWSRRHARRWYGPWIAATALIFFGSLATGWHYAIDGYVGALLAWASIAVADRLEPAGPADARPPSGASP
jgi:hypothetical protein